MTTPMQIVDGEFSRPLVESDVCRGYYNGPNGSHCATGWFHWAHFVVPNRANAWGDLLLNHARRKGFCTRSAWNDSPRTTTAEIVEVLNRTAREAGLLAEDTPCT